VKFVKLEGMHHPIALSEFIKLHTAHEVRLRSLAFGLVSNWADAEEVLQEANIILWQKFEEFESGTNFLAWSSQILRFTAKNFIARQRRSKLVFSDEVLDLMTVELNDAADELAERERILHQCIQKLKERQQRILELRYFQSKSVANVAEAIGSTAKAVYHALDHIHRALLQCVSVKLREADAR
jgi:RNA polymerase sigma-70 factor (ECF subfamily)